MPERKGLTAEERLADLHRAQLRLRRERLERELAGPCWRRMMQVVPVFFLREGDVSARVLRASREAVIEALRPDAVFALDTAMRLAHGRGFLSTSDIFAYLASEAPLARLAEAGLVEPTAHLDTVVSRPWAGPPRVLLCVVPTLPPWRMLESGARVVTDARLRGELIGEVGARADLFRLLERTEPGA